MKRNIVTKAVLAAILALPIACSSQEKVELKEDFKIKKPVITLETKLENQPVKLQGYFTDEEKESINKAINKTYSHFPKSKEILDLIIQKNRFEEDSNEFIKSVNEGQAFSNKDAKILELARKPSKLPVCFWSSNDPKESEAFYQEALRIRRLEDETTFRAENLTFRYNKQDIILLESQGRIEYLKGKTNYQRERNLKLGIRPEKVNDNYEGIIIHELAHLLINEYSDIKETIYSEFDILNSPIREKMVSISENVRILYSGDKFSFTSGYGYDNAVLNPSYIRMKYEGCESTIIYEMPLNIQSKFEKLNKQEKNKKLKEIYLRELSKQEKKGDAEDAAEVLTYIISDQNYADSNETVQKKKEILERNLNLIYK